MGSEDVDAVGVELSWRFVVADDDGSGRGVVVVVRDGEFVAAGIGSVMYRDFSVMVSSLGRLRGTTSPSSLPSIEENRDLFPFSLSTTQSP